MAITWTKTNTGTELHHRSPERVDRWAADLGDGRGLVMTHMYRPGARYNLPDAWTIGIYAEAGDRWVKARTKKMALALLDEALS
jgi:hypothetical protein